MGLQKKASFVHSRGQTHANRFNIQGMVMSTSDFHAPTYRHRLSIAHVCVYIVCADSVFTQMIEKQLVLYTKAGYWSINDDRRDGIYLFKLSC